MEKNKMMLQQKADDARMQKEVEQLITEANHR